MKVLLLTLFILAWPSMIVSALLSLAHWNVLYRYRDGSLARDILAIKGQTIDFEHHRRHLTTWAFLMLASLSYIISYLIVKPW